MSPSWLIDCRNTGNPLIDYTARPDEEWRHVPNNSDKIDETHLQEREYFYPGFKAKKWYIFFSQKHFYWLLFMWEIWREKDAIHHDWMEKSEYLYCLSIKCQICLILDFFFL